LADAPPASPRASAGIAEVSELARRSGQGADQVLAAAAELKKQAATLRHDATEFVNRVTRRFCRCPNRSSPESGDPAQRKNWIPACAGMSGISSQRGGGVEPRRNPSSCGAVH
jgi:hypothetical protein